MTEDTKVADRVRVTAGSGFVRMHVDSSSGGDAGVVVWLSPADAQQLLDEIDVALETLRLRRVEMNGVALTPDQISVLRLALSIAVAELKKDAQREIGAELPELRAEAEKIAAQIADLLEGRAK